jgi:predicted RNA-binding Zn-ribbon protein involved in translation (DUF1610 family)
MRQSGRYGHAKGREMAELSLTEQLKEDKWTCPECGQVLIFYEHGGRKLPQYFFETCKHVIRDDCLLRRQSYLTEDLRE